MNEMKGSEQYLGSKKPHNKSVIRRPSDKLHFRFNWDNTEDTSRDIYQNNLHHAQLLFGRGFRGGIDRRQQKKLSEDDHMKVDRHWSAKKVGDMTERDWRIFKEDFNISYKGSKVPKPMRNWAESKLCSELLKVVVERARYKTPTPIQMAAIPLGLQQRDVIGIAETGSGKTAAFVLPMLAYIKEMPPITEENAAEGIKVVSIVGGQSIEKQAFKIRQGCEIVIATPGRLLDCLERRYVVLNQCNYVVLDEADRMIDMGFKQQVVGVLDAMPSSNMKPENEEEELDEKKIYRTTYMFSATMPPSVERLARKYLRNPVVVTIGTLGKTTDRITQRVIMMKESEKTCNLRKQLDELAEYKTAIVSVNTRETADVVSKNLDKSGYRVTTLHGGRSQEQREISLQGRGIDVPDVAHVINFDMPGCIEKYTHRIGRTGRAGKTGVATTFLTLLDTDIFYDLRQMLIWSNSPVPPELARHEDAKFKPRSVIPIQH
uniref:RNA helicase n=1 Tax=Chenopodium quinoa TaxID=63459 RepID=A0A803MLB5_CHEQI